ncbi:MAG TPA: hypothetical protein VI588_02635, partial [Candidatus Gracilibacteria bacterium]|nr:hypothetical protein [Candidatus Gracilibacteria bacterium]
MAEGGVQLEKPKGTFVPEWPMIEKLFSPEEVAGLPAKKPDIPDADKLDKLTEEKIAKDPVFEKKVRDLSSQADLDPKFKEWLAERLQKALEQKEKAPAAPGVPIDVGAVPPASPDAGAQPAAPAEGQLPPSVPAEGEKPVAPGVTPAPLPGEPKPAEPPAGEAKAPEKKQKYDIVADQQKLHAMALPELMMEMFKRAGEFFKGFAGFAGSPEKLFTPAQVKEIKVDVQRDAEKKFTSDNRSVEYVCSVLNLPVKKDATTLLEALKSNSSFVYETDKNKFTNPQVGDVLFFQKADKPGVPYLTAVVSKLEPLSMKMVSDAGAPHEVEVMKSPQFQTEWMGFVRLPGTQKVD